MNALEKILEEIGEMRDIMESTVATNCFGKDCEHNDCTICVCERAMEIIRSHMDEVQNDGWIDCKKSMPTKNMDKKPVWIVYGSPMNLSVKFAYCDWTLSEDEYGNDDSYTQFYIPQAPFLYYPSLNLVHYWKPVNIPKFQKE